MFKLAFFFMGLASLVSACSKSPDQAPNVAAPVVESFPAQNAKFKNCHFKVAFPVYSLNSAIAPNPIQCDEGVAKTVQLLGANVLPAGVTFSTASLSLVGTPTEKTAIAPYNFYLENEAGYVILQLNLTVK
jgi:hypothetical protein